MLKINENYEVMVGKVYAPTDLTSLVYLKQGDTTTSFPGIEDYLNKISMNRLFCSFEIKDGGVIEVPDNINLNESISKNAFMDKLDDLYKQTFNENPWSCQRLGTGGSTNSFWFDYFYVTNANLIYDNERIEGAHREGGLRQPKTVTKGGYVNSSSVRNEIASHEFGHWLGLIHTFDNNKYLIKHHSKYNNIGAYMDYCSEEIQFPRERWFIYELREVLQSIKNLKSFIGTN